MDIIGIIAEYNPLHNGHLYHIKKCKELFPNSIIILVLNGYFLERGEISIITKENKTKLALETGIDIILELPFIFGTQSADTFAEASLAILNKYGVNKLIFGSESNDITLLNKIALKQESSTYNTLVKSYLDKGYNYPTAMARACEINFNFTPNDLLGISYLKAINKNNYKIEPISIKRTNNYHDITSNDEIISATNIRTKLINNEEIKKYVPNRVLENIIKIDNDIYFKLLKAKIVTNKDLTIYLDVDEGIEYRLKKYINKAQNLDEYINLIKTKRYTYNKLNRMFIHILIGLKKEDNIKEYTSKILGFNQRGKTYLNNIKHEIDNNYNDLIKEYEIKASIIYDIINNTNTYAYEKKNKPIIFD